MRGRKPRTVALGAEDRQLLQRIARSRSLPWFPVQRAHVLLAMADGESVQTVASWSRCDPSTVWRICRRYEQAGLDGIFAEAPRSGHPADISPCGPSADRATGVS